MCLEEAHGALPNSIRKGSLSATEGHEGKDKYTVHADVMHFMLPWTLIHYFMIAVIDGGSRWGKITLFSGVGGESEVNPLNLRTKNTFTI